MKFIGGTHPGQEAPDWVLHLVVAGQLEIEEHDAGGGWQSGGAPAEAPRVETYVVRTWKTYGREPFKFLAAAGKSREYIESLAWPLFGCQGD